MIWVILLSLLALVWFLDALRLRGRLSAVPTLAPDAPGEPVDDWEVVATPGLTVDAATLRAAAALARERGIAVLDLVPGDFPVWRLLMVFSTVDPKTYATIPLGRGRSAGAAVLVRRGLVERARVPRPRRPGDFVKFVHSLKHHAMHEVGFAIAPRLVTPPETPTERWGVARSLLGDSAGALLCIGALLFLLGLLAPLLWWPWGLLALAALHLQPLLATAGTGVRPRDLLINTALRAPVELVNLVRIALAPAGPADEPVEERRPIYEQLAAEGGPSRWFEPRRTDCPLCGSTALEIYVQTPDLSQHKPGEFTLERCRDCEHLFQNPRLSIAGLDYYYKDFYDGLGGDNLDAIFASEAKPYVDRARAIEGLATPRRWLDVGGGHGHFCFVARDVWKGTRFEGLDLSESIEQAAERGWIDRAIRGLFPDVAPELRARGERYDVVSMSHYLEHTRDPRSEIAAARQVLADGGHLLVEVPDPDCRIRHLLGRFWMPYFQPQHQHFVSVDNIARLLREEGFVPVRWHRGEAHQPVDFLFALYLFVQQIAPPGRRPWRPRASGWDLAWHNVAMLVTLPLLGIAHLLDKVTAPLFRRPGWSNTYRVVARKLPEAATERPGTTAPAVAPPELVSAAVAARATTAGTPGTLAP